LTTYEAQTHLRLGVSRCRTRVVFDTDTTPTLVNYTELCDLLKLLAVSACQCPCPYPYLCFI